MASEPHQLHIFFFPFMAHGHMLPMIDMAKVFAACGVKTSVVLTPLNAPCVEKSIFHAKAASQHIEILLLEFPSGTGLPEGTENLDDLTSPASFITFFIATGLLEKPFSKLVGKHLPDCVVSDVFFPWTVDVAKRFEIPRLIFNGSSFFTFCVLDSLERYLPEKHVGSDKEPFIVPGLPDPIELTKSQQPDFMKTQTDFLNLWEQIVEADPISYGVVVNSFHELEPAYVEHCKKEIGMKAWHVGPISLYNRQNLQIIERGKKSSISSNDCLRWLEGRKPHSVLYICFGSLCKFPPQQVLEIATALEAAASYCSFIWVVKETEIIPEGLEERMKEKGLVIRGWAPQILILNHPSVGGFMTHCGWNSVLEGISSGLPMITWPVFADQFFNEKLVTKVLKIGVEVGAETYVPWAEEMPVVIEREVIEKAVRSVMGEGEEAERMRGKARELGEMAKRSIQTGGSSEMDLSLLISELKMIRDKKIAKLISTK